MLRHILARPGQVSPPNSLTQQFPLFTIAGRNAAQLWLHGAPMSAGEYRADRFRRLIASTEVFVGDEKRRAAFDLAFEQELALAIARQSRAEVQSASESNDDALHIGDEVRSIYAGRTGTVVKVYPDGSACVRWHDGEPQPEGLGHERMPRRLLEVRRHG